MNVVHLHLLLNHVPIIGIVFAGAPLVLGVMRRDRAVTRIALGFLVVVSLVAIGVLLTGEPAEHAVEHVAGVSEAAIKQHEDVAQLATLATDAIGVLALVGLFLSRRGRPLARGLAYATLAMVVAGAGLMGATGYLGGQIRHSEIRAVAAGETPGDEEHSEAAEREKHEESERHGR